MPNLLGATLDTDRVDFTRLWQGYCPDEIKIYPCQLLANAELYEYWQRGEYTPYTQAELVTLIADIKPSIPAYCRVNRIIRDIPSTNVVAGNKRTSLRMDVQAEMAKRGTACGCIRCREVGSSEIDPGSLQMHDLAYPTLTSQEHFLSFDTPDGRLAGYLRLSIPNSNPGTQLDELFAAFPQRRVEEDLAFIRDPGSVIPDLSGAALIREVHVYGQSLAVGAEQAGAAQHIGLGTALIAAAEDLTRGAGLDRLAVISAIGTRRYYEGRGYQRGDLYMFKQIP
jgi:elongator complex protein 3